MRKSNERGSVFTLLLRNYVLLTLFLLLFLTALFIGLLQNMKIIVGKIEPSQIFQCRDILAQRQFEDFPIKQILSADGGILIVDDQCKPVYQNGKALPVSSFDKNDIACIPEYSLAPEITTNEITTADGQRHVSISISETRDGKAESRIYILDRNNTILYQPGDLPMDTLTERQVRLLSDSFAPDYSIQKHSFRTADGKDYTMLLIGDPARPETAEFVKIFDSFYSLSQRLRQSEEERKKLEAGRQKMLADISHDLRTPISVVQGYAKALCDGVIPIEQQPQYLEIIEQKASGLNDLINTFYEYSKMDHPDYALKLVPSDICNTLRDYVADRYAELELAEFLIEVDIPEKHISCALDIMALRRGLDNLVNNSIRHNPSGTTLSVSLMLDSGKVRIVISDNGSGIPAELRKSIFTPFVVGDASRSNHGSGLGLSITKKIIEAHGGSITLLNSETSGGTAFEILLPTK